MMAPSARTGRITLRAVTSRSDWREFYGLAHRLHRGDPSWIAPLTLVRRQQWSPQAPWFEHGRAKAWLAWCGNTPVGCISAQIDDLHEKTWGERLGYFGQLDAIDDPEVFEALLGTATDWLRKEDVTQVRGPYDLSVNQSCGLLVEGFDTPPMMLMGHARPYYQSHIQAAGFSPAMDLLAYRVSPHFETPKAVATVLRRVSRRMTLRPLDRRRFAEEMELLRDIFNDAWSNNWGFVPFTENEFRRLGRDIRPLLRKGYIQIAELDGEPAAFIVTLPNFNEFIRDFGGKLWPANWARLLWRLRSPARTARVPLMGVRKAFQGGILGSALAFGVIEAARRHVTADGVEEVELSWILDTNQGMRSILEAIGADVYKRYRIYQRALT